MVARLCRFKSCCPHQKKTIRKGCLFSCDSGLETKLRFVGKRHCVCLPLHAVQLAQRFASKLARLCYYARFALYKSCCPHQKKTIRKGCLFSCDSGLETKLRFVGKRHCVCLPLHAADAPLGNNIALLMLLRSLRSLQVLLSAPSVMVYKSFLIDHHFCVFRGIFAHF